MADKTWKRIEREKCRELGGERSGPTGRDTPDCAGTCVGLEVKSYKTFTWLTKDWQQAKDNAAKIGQPPVLAMKERGRGGRDMVQMHSAHWVTLEIGAYGSHPVYDEDITRYVVDGDEVVRLSWDWFVHLYLAYYTDRKEATTGN